MCSPLPRRKPLVSSSSSPLYHSDYPDQKRYTLMSGPPLQLTIPWHNSQISSFPTDRGAMVLSHALLQMDLHYFQFTPLNREISCQQQTQCQGEIYSVDCGPCSSACMILPSRSTELFPISWQRMIVGNRPAPSSSSARSLSKPWASRSVGQLCFPSCHRKRGRTLNFMEDHWRKMEEAHIIQSMKLKSIWDERCGTQSNPCP